MRWAGQVVHVAGKDLRQSWWQLLVYVIVVALATLAGADLLGGGWMGAGMLFVCGAGVLVFATLIHADPPARTTAMWGVWPLEWSAVLAAKLVLAAVVLIGLGLAGQAVVLVAHDLAGWEILRLLGVSALAYAGVLVFAGMLAVVTPDVRGFTLALLLVLIALQFVGYAVLMRVGERDPGPAVSILPAAVGLLVMMWQYRSFDRNRAIAVVLLVLLLPTALTALTAALPSPSPDAAAPATVPPDLQQPVRMSDSGVRSGDYGMVVSVTVDTAAAGHRYLLRDARVALLTSDGARSTLEARSSGSLNAPRLVMDGKELISPNEGGRSPRPGGLTIDLTREQAAALEQGQARLEVMARVEVQESHVLGVAPLVAGTSYAARGLRLEILDVDHAERQVTLTTSSIEPPDPSRGSDSPSPHILAVVNQTRSPAEEFTLHRRSGGGNSLGAVLPGPQLDRWTGVYAADWFATPVPAPAPDWMREASLLVGEWISLGTYPITVIVGPRETRSRSQ